MVSLWPWRGPDNSPASFEKALAGLSEKIAQSNGSLEVHRQRARRFKALWTLYTTFAYILYALIAALVLGWERWGPVEYTALSGSPVVIYTVRRIGAAFFQYRITKTQKYLGELQKQRDVTIEKLKEATKYNSTLQLLEKYGAEPPRSPSPQEGADDREGMNQHGGSRESPRSRPSLPFQGPRTRMTPPPTANIRRPQTAGSLPSSPMGQGHDRKQVAIPSNPPSPSSLQLAQMQQQAPSHPPDEPGFHPSAFPPTQNIEPRQPQWYDRILDVLLGEDETLPKNRLALICVHCRLVNGQAAPGIRTLEEVGRWRCVGCGGWNGEEKKDTATHDMLRKEHIRRRSESTPQRPAAPVVVVEPSAPTDGDSPGSQIGRKASVSSDVYEGEGLSAGEDADWSSDAELEPGQKGQSDVKEEPSG
ncbi:endoplasmic reticulum junction formation protein [Trichophyton mentagrophytes]|nr:endoplasmic reticulum junction formation protein [Trichophyton mentagrophytes]